MSDQADGAPVRNRRASVVRIVGILIGVVAVALCVRTLVVEWPSVRGSVLNANLGLIGLAAVTGAAGLWFLALMWLYSMRIFSAHVGLGRATVWFFAGQLGKYLPGGIWPVVGQGELANRGGVARRIAYSTTLLSTGLMCVGGAAACVLLAPLAIAEGSTARTGLWILLLIPAGVLLVHPAVFGRALAAASKVTKGRLQLDAPSWGQMITLIAISVPTWLLLGASNTLVAASLGFGRPAQVAFAAVVAWIVGVLAVPVPAGAGVRELVFVALSGLPAGDAIAVAAVARIMFISVDLVLGLGSLLWLRTKVPTRADKSGRAAP